MSRGELIETDLVKDKMAQAHAALKRESVDLWLIFLQETSVYREPMLDYLIGQEVTWQSAFLFCATGESVAIVGNFDVDSFLARGCFHRVVGYTRSVAPSLANEIRRLRPNKIALNYAADDPTADGLTHGLFLVLQEILSEAGAKGTWIPSKSLVRAVRGCKTHEELARIETAVQRTEAAFDTLCSEGLIGKSERQIASRIAELADRAGCDLAFDSIVNAGTKSAVGHTHPTEAKFAVGDLLHLDFGFRYQSYCADLQRCVYALRPGESAPPPALTRAFSAVADCIQDAYDRLKPGLLGKDIDRTAREFITGRGYPEYQHALGHQLGRAVHDGGTLLGPEWPRYGDSPRWPVEVGQVFTLELEAEVPGVGYASLEEDVVVTEAGSRWLSRPQRAPILLGG